MTVPSDWQRNRPGHYARAYYTDDVEPPKEPGGFAIEVWAVNRAAAQLDLDIFERRTDIGRVETWEVP